MSECEFFWMCFFLWDTGGNRLQDSVITGPWLGCLRITNAHMHNMENASTYRIRAHAEKLINSHTHLQCHRYVSKGKLHCALRTLMKRGWNSVKHIKSHKVNGFCLCKYVDFKTHHSTCEEPGWLSQNKIWTCHVRHALKVSSVPQSLLEQSSGRSLTWLNSIPSPALKTCFHKRAHFYSVTLHIYNSLWECFPNSVSTNVLWSLAFSNANKNQEQ